MSANNSSISTLSSAIYNAVSEMVTGKLIRKSACAWEQARIRMVFDYIFTYTLLLIPIIAALIFLHDLPNLVITTAFAMIFVCCGILMSTGIPHPHIGILAALNTLLTPMACSFLNDMDISPIYAIPWLMACMLGYFAVSLRTSLSLMALLLLYLGIAAWMKLDQIRVNLPPTYSVKDRYLATPFLMLVYLVIILRVWGVYFRNIFRLEREQTLQKQQEFSSLINQNLIKQFLLVKGLSRSGKDDFLEGNTDLVDARFSEIEKQCDSAIHYLDGRQPD
ncbi:hypothetical protein [Chitinophaga deserti]|uniref:hypothetical protein n=1 Tax=Chitinophaga deserti TaxID=2164099 RepID=UPI000D6AFE80|nr:hypothetical protein [Chitinophaga deserti]